jgi:hypothetical protein
VGAKYDDQGPSDPWSEFLRCVPTGRPQENTRRKIPKSRESDRFSSKKQSCSAYCVPNIGLGFTYVTRFNPQANPFTDPRSGRSVPTMCQTLHRMLGVCWRIKLSSSLGSLGVTSFYKGSEIK